MIQLVLVFCASNLSCFGDGENKTRWTKLVIDRLHRDNFCRFDLLLLFGLAHMRYVVWLCWKSIQSAFNRSVLVAVAYSCETTEYQENIHLLEKRTTINGNRNVVCCSGVVCGGE